MSGIEAVISGVGQSAVGRRLPDSGLSLTVDAALEAIADAGLEVGDIDGLTTYPGIMRDMPAFSPVSTNDMRDALDLKLDYWAGGGEGSAQLGAIINAYAAVKAGIAKHVLCFRTVKEGSGGAAWKDSATASTERTRIFGDFEYIFPYDAISATHWLTLYAQRYLHDYGATRELFGRIVINSRRNAALNPKAIYADANFSMEDYLNAKMITTPFGLFDCDAPTDAATVIIVSAADALPAGRPKLRIEAVGGGIKRPTGWDQSDMPRMAAHDAGPTMWKHTKLKPSDVDVALLYDGFSFLSVNWLEAMGFCGEGEATKFIGDGETISLTGKLPLNPHGGQLSSGRTHGFGFVHEAALQLRGEAGERQVKSGPRVAAIANGGGPVAGCMLLVRDDA